MEKYDKTSKRIIMVTGGASSGKSSFGESIARNYSQVTYIATSKTNQDDPDWTQRIHIHKSRRPSHWKLCEDFEDINILFQQSNFNGVLLIDSIGGIVTNSLIQSETEWYKFSQLVLQHILKYQGIILLIAEEVGLGLIPSTSLGNKFRIRLGDFNQRLQGISTDSWFLIQGKAINLNNLASGSNNE
tara:strand:+ start:143 stop:703 length:561 start_codon:yes stop_codon:yes gene_type:complete